MAGGDVASAGEMKVVGGQLKAISNKSGHYQPQDEHMVNVLQELAAMGVQLTGVEVRVVIGGRLQTSTQDAHTWLTNQLQARTA